MENGKERPLQTAHSHSLKEIEAPASHQRVEVNGKHEVKVTQKLIWKKYPSCPSL
jgi:hypothetical protein